jgi:hypothetical protein
MSNKPKKDYFSGLFAKKPKPNGKQLPFDENYFDLEIEGG